MTPTSAHAGTRHTVRSEAGARYRGVILAITETGIIYMEVVATQLGNLDWVTHGKELRRIVGAEIVEEE